MIYCFFVNSSYLRRLTSRSHKPMDAVYKEKKALLLNKDEQ